MILIWVVVLKIFYFHPYLGKWFNLTNIFQMGWNHQLVPHSFTIRASQDSHEWLWGALMNYATWGTRGWCRVERTATALSAKDTGSHEWRWLVDWLVGREPKERSWGEFRKFLKIIPSWFGMRYHELRWGIYNPLSAVNGSHELRSYLRFLVAVNIFSLRQVIQSLDF